MMKVGLIGCGLQGWRRARAVREYGDRLVVVADVDEEKGKALADEMRCEASTTWEDVVANKDIEMVIVCAPNNLHVPMSVAALENGKHVLCEKPLGRNPEEARKILDSAKKSGKILKCGLNLRHHPGISQVRKWFDDGVIGELSFLRCRYGTCGRSGYEREWRANLEIAGGGELLDQGMHILDLFRWFAGGFSQAVGFTATTYWNVAPLEDNAFALLRTAKGQIATIHVSWSQWKNLFSFEVFGKEGYAIVEGLGGSYGVERAILGRRRFSDPFKEEIVDFRGEDCSWREEWREFVSAIKEDRDPMGNGSDGLEALKLVYAIYESNRKNSVIHL